MKKRTAIRQQVGRYIVADPRICHGKLTFRGTRIFVADVLEQVAEGLAWESIVESWGGSYRRGNCRGCAVSYPSITQTCGRVCR